MKITIFEVSVKIQSQEEPNNSYAITFTSQESFHCCWEQIEGFIKRKFDGKPHITHVLNTASFDVLEY